MTADVTVPAQATRATRRRSPAFGLSWRILGARRDGGDDRRGLDLPAVDRPLPRGLSRAADRKRHPGRPRARRHARQHGDRGGQAQPAQPCPGRRRRAGRAQQAQARPDEHRAARRHAELQSEGPRRPGPDLGRAGGDGAGRFALHPGRRRIDAPADGHGLDRRRRAADADRDVRLRRPHPRAVDHHRAVHRHPALSRRCAGWSSGRCRICRPT